MIFCTLLNCWGVRSKNTLIPIHLIILVIHEVQKAILIALADVMKDTCNNDYFMHQSIPAVPISPRATAGHLLRLSVPGVGHSQFYRSPGGWALAYPGATLGHLTHVISLWGRTRPLSKTGLSIRD